MSSEQAQVQQTAEKTTGLLDEIVEATKVRPTDETWSVTKSGVKAFLDELLKPERQNAKISQAVIVELLAEIDRKMSRLMDSILHHEEFQKLESAWRGLKFLVDRTNFRENIKIDVVDVSKPALLSDFEDAPEITKSGLYKQVYTNEYGQFGGQPYSAMIANYEFDNSPQDMSLLQSAASVATMAHAPFLASVNEKFFSIDSFNELPALKDLRDVFEGVQYTKWRSLRDSDDARSIGLTLPRFLLRLPYGQDSKPAQRFDYTENVSGAEQHFCWGNSAFAFASRLTESFAKYRWCANIIGPQGGGAVGDLPVYLYESMNISQMKIPTQILISERREYELAEEGFIALAMRKGSDNAAFFSANSIQKAKYFGNTTEGKAAELNYKLGTQLPYMFIISRLAHYIKVLQRENIGTWKNRGDIETELRNWLKQYIADQEDVSPKVRSKKPLRKAEIIVSDVEGDPGWYSVTLKVVPHFKYMGANFELSLVGKLDKQ